jgi:DNA-binding NarL/FixJ family response regulator
MQLKFKSTSPHATEPNPILDYKIVGEFCLKSSYFLVIAIEALVENSKRLTLDALAKTIPFTVCGYFDCDGACYMIVKAINSIDSIESSLANLLTGRELQIAALVASGWSNKQVANQLQISEWTVSAHLRRIFIKLKVDTRSAMVYRCASLITQLHHSQLGCHTI